MMDLFLGLFLLSLAAMIFGLVTPRLALPWLPAEKRTRGRALGIYLVLAIAFFVGFGLASDAEKAKQAQVAQQAEPTQPAQAEATRDSAVDEEAAYKAWRAYQAEYSALHAQAEELFGYSPSTGLNPGDAIVLEEETPIAPNKAIRNPSMEESLQSLASLRRLPVGEKLEIRQRYLDGKTWMYEVYLPKRDVVGYVHSTALHWYNTMDRMTEWDQRRSAWMEPRLKELAERLYGPLGLDFIQVETMALEGKWRERK